MKIRNVFTIGKSANIVLSSYLSIDDNTGEITNTYPIASTVLGSDYTSVGNLARFVRTLDKIEAFTGYVFFYDSDKNFIEKAEITEKSLVVSSESFKYVAFKIESDFFEEVVTSMDIENFCILETLIVPHYKKLNKKYSKESNQYFFRETLDGNIELWNYDYNLIKDASLNDTLILSVYQNGELYQRSNFIKTDCEFDHFKKSVKIKFTSEDKYSDILDKYENVYDLIKLSPGLKKITYTKRCLIQIYIQGENVISNYFGGTYWDDEVLETIDSESQLINHYKFSKGPKLQEVSIIDVDNSINAAYKCIPTSDIWNSITSSGSKCSIVFEKVASAGSIVSQVMESKGIKLLSTGQDGTYKRIVQMTGTEYFIYDIYSINIYDDENGTGNKIYSSVNYYAKNTQFFELAQGSTLYEMRSSDDLDDFYLGDCVIEYQIWGRLLCDVETSTDGDILYDLPYDDFATSRANFKKCIGLSGFDSQSAIVKIVQTDRVSNEPTAYGLTDYNQYFLPPSDTSKHYIPLARNTWANTSLWVYFDYEFATPNNPIGFENFCRKFYKRIVLKDAYHISDVIKVLLKEINPDLRHEWTEEYSIYLYANRFSENPNNQQIFITQRTNILKGEYDQAAKKAEISLKQIMDMLRDCFQCYCFVDSENRFRIEHISYFKNNMSYEGISEIQIDLTKKIDRFNKKITLYDQQTVKYEKTELDSRYEFSWDGDVTDAMGQGLTIDINAEYVDKSKTKSITVSGFISDLDFMLFAPDKFANDGFALILANFTSVSRHPYTPFFVPIVYQQFFDEKQKRNQVLYTQNYYASFNWLVHNYMDNMPAYDISCPMLPNLYVTGLIRSMKHSIDVQMEEDPDVNKLIKTELGNGHIEEMSSDVDTKLIQITLSYPPS